MESSKKNIDKGFSKISHEYEELDKTSSLVNWMRMRVRNHIEKQLKSSSNIVELNCGSGIDAVYLAKQGHTVHATDIANGMINCVSKKKKEYHLDNLTCEQTSYLDLENFKDQKYDHLFSNFGGLNCSSLEELKPVFNNFKQILNKNGKITLVIMPKICLWEMIRIFLFKKHAFRRFAKNGVFANVENESVKTYYHKASDIQKMLSKDFHQFKVENICFFAPTGNRIHFPEKHPVLFKFLIKLDTFTNKIPLLQGYGDYYMISATKK